MIFNKQDSNNEQNQNDDQTIEQVLTEFVEFMTNYNEKSSNAADGMSRNNIPRTLLETVLQDMIYSYVRARTYRSRGRGQDKVKGGDTINPKDCCDGPSKKSMIVQSYSRNYTAKELRRILLFFSFISSTMAAKDVDESRNVTHKTAKNKSRIHILCDSEFLYHPKEIYVILHQLVDFLFQRMALISTRQKKEIERLLLSRFHMNSKKKDDCDRQNKAKERIQSKIIINEESHIDTEKIVHQINILKKGGYWQHLPKEVKGSNDHNEVDNALVDGRNEIRHYHDDNNSRYHFSSHDDDEKDTDKENTHCLANKSYANRTIFGERNFQLLNAGANDEDEDEDDEASEDYDEENFETNGVASEGGFVFRICALGANSGFYVCKIIEDGWLCSHKLESKDEECSLLRLPSKVCRLGRQGMKITGVDLMQRVDNGVLEPCNAITDDSQKNDHQLSLRIVAL